MRACKAAMAGGLGVSPLKKAAGRAPWQDGYGSKGGIHG